MIFMDCNDVKCCDAMLFVFMCMDWDCGDGLLGKFWIRRAVGSGSSMCFAEYDDVLLLDCVNGLGGNLVRTGCL